MKTERPARTIDARCLLAEDWETRLDLTLAQTARLQASAWEPLVGAALTQTAANVRATVSRALPGVVSQVEQWLRDNQRNLARYSEGGGNVTPNQSATWQGAASAVWDFAERQANTGPGGQVRDLHGAAQTWLLLWDWTPEQWGELIDLTRPGMTFRPGDTFYGVALAVGAKVSFARTVLELKDRYKRLTPNHRPLG